MFARLLKIIFCPNFPILVDQLERYLRWYEEGYLSSNGVCFDIGTTTLSALTQFKKTRDAFCGPSAKYNAGNGSLMRLAPVPLFYGNNPQMGILMSGESSKTTHQTPLAIDACRYLGALIIGALHEKSKMECIPMFIHRNSAVIPMTLKLVSMEGRKDIRIARR